MAVRESGEGTTRTNKTMAKTVYAVSDKTGSIQMTVWGDVNFEVGQWYTVEEASVRVFWGKVVLTTTPQSRICDASDAGVAVSAVEDTVKIVSGEIISGNVSIDYMCPKRHSLPEVNMAELVTKCDKCDTFCKIKKLAKHIKGSLTISDQQGEYHTFFVEESVLRKVLGLVDGAFYQPDQLSKLLLQFDNAEFHLRGRRVVELVVSNEGSTQDCAREGSEDFAVQGDVAGPLEFDQFNDNDEQEMQGWLSSVDVGDDDVGQRKNPKGKKPVGKRK